MTKERERSKSRDRRRVATGRDLSDFDYEPLKTNDWNFIQDKLRAKLPTDLRQKLSGITMLYAAAQSPRSTRPLSEVTKEIDLWRRQTEVLIKNVWDVGLITARPKTDKMTLIQISEKYLRFSQNILTANYPMSQLAHFLEGAVAVSNYFISLLKSSQFKSDRKTELWLVWAALVIACCRESGIQVQKPNRKELNPGFVVLLDKLQKTLPTLKNVSAQNTADGVFTRKRPTKHVRSPTGVPFKTGVSLSKNAKRAFAVAAGTSIADLYLLLSVWVLGLSQVGVGRLATKDMEPVLSRLNDQMKIISPRRNDLTG